MIYLADLAWTFMTGCGFSGGLSGRNSGSYYRNMIKRFIKNPRTDWLVWVYVDYSLLLL